MSPVEELRGAFVALEWGLELAKDHAETIYDDQFPDLKDDEWWEMVKASLEKASSIIAKAKEESQ